jgi:hypothetical protein
VCGPRPVDTEKSASYENPEDTLREANPMLLCIAPVKGGSARRAEYAQVVRVQHERDARSQGIDCLMGITPGWSANLPQPRPQLKDSARCQCDH